MTENRKVTYRLYPTVKQAQALGAMFEAHRMLYNVALEQRIVAYRVFGASITFAEQCRDLTELRAADPFWAGLNAQSEQVTLRRVDRAFEAFFRRVRNGEGRPGFPRFKSSRRFSGWGYKSHGDGWKLQPGPDGKHGRLRLSDVGEVKIRGQARTAGAPKTCEILRKGTKWYASVTLAVEPVREAGNEELGFDWGVEHFLTLSTGETVENPRWVRRAQARIETLQQQIARKKKGSKGWWKIVDQLGGLHRKIAGCRHDFLHQTSADLVGRAALLGTERLEPKKMTRSAKGTVEKPGKMVAQKAGLNRSVLDAAPAAFMNMVRYKPGTPRSPRRTTWLSEAPLRTAKPSQTCPDCGAVAKKTLSERTHACPCGSVMPRDQAAALVCLEYALWEKQRDSWVGNRPRAPQRGPETPSIAA